MRTSSYLLSSIFIVLFCYNLSAQEESTKSSINNKTAWFSLGARSTVSTFDHDGTGLGTGGQFRLQLSNRVNTDWFADYININTDEGIRSTYYHIGWSVLFYVFKDKSYPKLFQPYIMAGHCFDFNKKTLLINPSISESRWGSAVQAGLGTHINLTERFDVSLTSQYMIHFTKSIELDAAAQHHHHGKTNALEGHLLTTLSLNYKLFKLKK